jgi:cytoskeletal protein CcmA (bactofilin family)
MLQSTQNPANAPKYPPNPNTFTPPKNIGSTMEQATIGRSVVIKGEISGAESLYIDGRIEGTVNFDESRVTIGRNGVVVANISAKEVVIMGKVTGNIHCTDRLDIRSEGSLTGDVVTPRVCVEDGAVLKGAVEVRTAQPSAPQLQNEKPQAQPKPVEAVKSAEPSKAAVAAAGAGTSATLAHGSKVMYNESN